MKKEKIQTALRLVKPGLANTEFLEQSTSFAFMGNRVVTYNDEISISHPIEGMELTGAVKAEEFYQLLSKLSQDEIEIQVKDNELVITVDKIQAGLVLQEKIALPLDEISKIGTWYKLPENFINGLKFTLPSTSSDTSRPVLTCLHIRKVGILEASDGFRVTRFKINEMPINSFLLPANNIQTLIKYPITQIAKGEGWCHFKTEEGTIFSCRTFEDIFPDIDKTKIMEVEGEELVFPKTLVNIIDRATVFAKNELTLDKEIIIIIANKKIIVQSQSEFGWFEEEANIRYTNTPITFSIHPDFLKEMLSTTTACIVGESSIKFTGENWEHVIWLKGGE